MSVNTSSLDAVARLIEADVAIIGAGTAGSILATDLARDGKKVVIFGCERTDSDAYGINDNGRLGGCSLHRRRHP